MHAKTDLNKKSFPKQKTIQNFTIGAQGFRKTRNENPPMQEISRSYQLTSAGPSAHGWQIGRHCIGAFSFLVFLNL